MSPDPFGTAGLRAAVLAAWVAHPARFREDANAEEDHGRGYYRDRVVVELAQNAADAAVRAGVPGRLLLRLTTTGSGGTLVAANTGAVLDAAGVASLASLRASAKRSAVGPAPEGHVAAAPTVGRFGVGFAAVRSVADEVVVASTSGAVHFSLERTAELLARDVPPDLTAEVDRRHGSLPALRLPFAVDGPVDLVTGAWDTAVVLTLRDLPAVEQVRSQLEAVGDALLLALPGLAAVEVDVDGRFREVRDVTERWVVANRSGNLDPRLLADRPVEERDRTGWQVTWAVPRRGTTAEHAAVVHAPTPTDEPCTVPALLVATFPLDPSRRHVAPGPLTDVLVARAGEVWAELLSACRDEQERDRGAPDRTGHGTAPHPLDLIVGGLPAGALDSALREVVVEASRRVPVFSPVDGGPALSAGEVVVLDGPAGRDPAVLRVLGAWLPGLVEIGSHHRHLVRLLDLATTELGDVVDALPTTEPDRLIALYDAFAAADSSTLEQLATLPVLLADGRTVRGARGLVLLDEGVDPAAVRSLNRWGLRVVEPRAAHPLLERLGATRADAAALLRHPVLRERVLGGDVEDDVADVETLVEGDDLAVRRDGEGGSRRTDPTALVVLGLISAVLRAGVTPDREPWFGEVLLPAADGELVPASGLVLPGSPAAQWFDPEVLPPLDASRVERWGAALEVVGVRSGLTVVSVHAGDDESAARSEDDGLLSDALDGWDEYLDLLGPDVATATELHAVADLDAVRDEAWPAVLHALVAGEARRALIAPVRLPDGGTAPSYTAWWLRRRGGLGLDRPFALPDAAAGPGATRGPGQRAVAALLGEAPAVVAGLDAEVLGVLGGVADTADLDEAGWADVLDALPVVAEPVDLALAVEIWRGLARRAVRDPGFAIDLERVSVLPALVDDGHGRPKAVVVPADEVAVATPMWAQHLRAGPFVVVPPSAASAMAEALDADLAAEREAGAVTSVGNVVPTPEVIGAVFPAAPATWVEHEDLLVDGEPVDWWVVEPEVPGGSPTVHAATTDGLVRGLAHVLGAWHAASIERLLTDPASAPAVLLDLAGQEEP
ncbi:sacsin N-terminal ATP-binding-like domain-containing protein [Cellulomonas sp. KRMCY2]|uniref:sacsin N-terminal ATP-binding-like domain-containing protein n=1 Tax=Cellulomonas sp. KRMCY2 TaxID=1304865 RepID=UPI00045E9451|nr:hypothetical protein [Cellulomonas sp. KRMCY2]